MSAKKKPANKLSIADMNRQRGAVKADLHERIMATADMLEHAFMWDKTPEGHDYWASVYENLIKLAHPGGLD